MLITIAVSVGVSLLSAGLTWLMSEERVEPVKGPWSGDPKRFRPVDGDPIPVIFGTVDLSPAVVWEGEVERGVPGEESMIPGRHIKLNALPIHWVVCAGPIDKISEVTISTDAERALKLWGNDSPEDALIFRGIGSVNPEGVDVRWTRRVNLPVDPNLPSIDNSVEARVLGGMQTTGLPTDSPPWGADIGFRRVVSMYGKVFAVSGVELLFGAEYQDDSATPGSLRLRATRIFARSHHDGPEGASWYESKATKNGRDMNPIHVLHDVLTDTIWGPTHLDPSDIDDVSFKAAADLMYDEGIFMSARLSSREDSATFLAQVFALCNAAPYQEPTTGKYAIAIATDDYSPSSLPVFGDSNSSGEMVRQYAKNMATRMVIQYTRHYSRSSSMRETSIPVAPDEERHFSQTNPAMYAKYGEVEVTHDYREIRDPKVASKLATRDLLTLSKPLAALSLTTSWGVEAARDLRPGSPFIWGSEIAGIPPIVYRVTSIDFGSGSDPAVKIEAVEDAFAFPDALEPDPPESQWEDPSEEPVPATPRVPFQLPLWLWYQLDLETNPYAQLADHKDAGARPYALAAGRPIPDARDFALHVDGVTRRSRENFTTFYTTDASVPQSATTVRLADENASLDFGPGFTPIIMIGEELMEVTAWNATTKTATVCRGWLDTVPSLLAHAAGSSVAVLGATYDGGSRFTRQFSTDNRLISSGTVDIKALTRTSLGTLSPDDAPSDVLDMAPWRDGTAILLRSLLPLPPANLRFIPIVGGGTRIRWTYRDRLSAPVCDSATSDGKPIVGTFTLEIVPISGGGSPRTVTGITAEVHDYTAAQQAADGVSPGDFCIFALWSVDPSGRESWQKYVKRHQI